MWIFSKYGFYSVVTGDKNTLQFRARNKEHLLNLKDRFALKPFKIKTTKQADYRYRIVLPKKEGQWLIEQLGKDIDYPNFKDEAKLHLGEGEYITVLHCVWNMMYNYQEDPREYY